MNNREEVCSFLEKKKSEGYIGRLGKVFSTDNHNYYYDTGTGKIAEIDDGVFNILKCTLENGDFRSLKVDEDAWNQIWSGIKNEHILSSKELKCFYGGVFDNLKEKVDNEMEMLTLEVTTACDLRCKYCIYSDSRTDFRGFGNEMMAWNTAKKALDLFIKHSEKTEEPFVSFYGGEPLLNFSLIEKCVEYSEKEFLKQKRKVKFSMTTNGTLMTEDIAAYLVRHNFSIIFSVDGEEKYHNRNRIFIDGRGSFFDTMRGINYYLYALEKYGKDKLLTLNAVIDKDVIWEQMDSIENWKEEMNQKADNIQFLFSSISRSPEESNPVFPQSEEEVGFFKEKRKKRISWSEENKNRNQELFTKGELDKQLLRIHQRYYSEEPSDDYTMTGCCIPAKRRLYVTTNGKFYLCERVGNVPSIGDVEHGVDIEAVQKHYINDFSKEAKKYCKNCWAINMCSLCYIDSFDSNGVHFSYRHADCVSERFSLEDTLIRYHKILEEEPEKIKELDSYELT